MALVALRAAALNFADLLMAAGRYQEQPAFPFVAGLEGVGTVLAAGDGVRLAPGTRVAVAAQGTLAEAMLAPGDRLLPVPDGVSDADAAGFQIAYGTAHLALSARARLRAGETLAVLGAGGGAGLGAVELGAALGARVIGVTRGGGKAAAVRRAGAEAVLDAGEGDLTAALKALGGVQVVYDAVGGAIGRAAFGALRPGGRHLVIGFAAGAPAELPLNHALVKNLDIVGVNWGAYRSLDPALLRASLEALLDMLAAGRLRPAAPRVMPLAEAAQAFALLRSGEAVGKIVLMP